MFTQVCHKLLDQTIIRKLTGKKKMFSVEHKQRVIVFRCELKLVKNNVTFAKIESDQVPGVALNVRLLNGRSRHLLYILLFKKLIIAGKAKGTSLTINIFFF